MIVWKYTILSNAGSILTSNTEYAEKKSKSGYRVYCKRENNKFKFIHK
jgi:hypothetical protein